MPSVSEPARTATTDSQPNKVLLARELGIKTVIVPVHTGLFSSLGLLVADTEYQVVAPYTSIFDDVAILADQFDSLEKEVVDRLSSSTTKDVTIERLLDMRYRGQRFELRISLPDGTVDKDLIAAAFARFHAEHFKTYGRASGDDLVEIVNLRIRGSIVNPIGIDKALTLPPADPGQQSTRTCRFADDIETPILRRTHLTADPVSGPFVVEDMDSTTLVPPGATAHLDRFNNIVINWNNAEVSE